MHFFYYKDKNQNFAVRGVCPHNDENCLPFDYFRLGHAKLVAEQLKEILKCKCTIDIPDDAFILDYALGQTDQTLEKQLKTSPPNQVISTLLRDNSMNKNKQISILKGVTLQPNDILWLNKEAQDLRYLLNIYHVETYPEKFNEERQPACFYTNHKKNISKIDKTDMTDGELNAFLEQHKVVQVRIYHNGEQWHCFYFTFKGLSGQEKGDWGSKPHWHYLSDKFGITLEQIKECINNCKMPTSEVHLFIDINV